MSSRRANAALADKIASYYADNKGKGSYDWEMVRDICDSHTGGDFPSGELDKLTNMVLRRLDK